MGGHQPWFRDYKVKWIGVGAVLVALVMGYVLGRSHVLAIVTAVVFRVLPLERMFSEESSDHVQFNRTYKALNGLLDSQLVAQREQASVWKRLLKTEQSSERKRILSSLREQIYSVLGPWPGPRPDLAPRSQPWFSRSGVEVSLVEITAYPGVTLTCALALPKNMSSSRPAILALHGMNGNLESVMSDIDYHHGFAFRLAEEGFIVLAPLRVASTIETRNTLYSKAMAAGWNFKALSLWQLVRAVDYLYTLEEVDVARIGVYGISSGGEDALWLAAWDDRLSAAVVSGYFTERFSWLLKRGHQSASRPPGNTMATGISPRDTVLFMPAMKYSLDDLNLVALVAPRFVVFVTGKEDPRYFGAKSEFGKVKRLYTQFGYPERASFVSFEGGHETSVESVLPLLKKWGPVLSTGH